MTYYSMHTMKLPDRRYDITVVLPLAVVTIFCFAFVLMHPYYKQQPTTASEVTASASASLVKPTKPVIITPLLSHITTIPVPATSSSSSASAQGSSTTQTPLTNSKTSGSISLSTTEQSSNVSTKTLQPAPTSNPKVTTPRTILNDADSILESL